jgi:hypothetical protein
MEKVGEDGECWKVRRSLETIGEDWRNKIEESRRRVKKVEGVDDC